jgi:hypothetical protein
VDNADRATFGKLRDADLFRRLAADGAFDYPPIASELTIDTSALAPDTAAERIARRLQA